MSYNKTLYTSSDSAFDSTMVYDSTEEKLQSEINAELFAASDLATDGLMTDYITDSVPYSFRASGSKDTGGNIEIDKLVGGTVVWNQLVLSLNAASEVYGIKREVVTVDGHNALRFYGTATNTTNFTVGSLGSNPYNAQDVVLFSVGTTLPSGAAINLAGGYNSINAVIMKSNTVYNNFGIAVDTGTSIDVIAEPQAYNLTKMFGTTIADYIYGLETATAGAGVAYFRSLFPNSYYAYNAGTLMSVNAASHETVGKNLFDKSITFVDNSYINAQGGISSDSSYSYSDYIDVLPSTNYCFSGQILSSGIYNSVAFYNASKEFISRFLPAAVNTNAVFQTPSNCRYIRFNASKSYKDVNTIQLEVGTTATSYEPYTKHTYPLDSTLTLRGIPKLDSNNKLYYDGDTYASDGTVTRRYAQVTFTGSNVTTFGTATSGIKYVQLNGLSTNSANNLNKICTRYSVSNNAFVDKSIRMFGATVYLYDNDFTDQQTAIANLNANPVTVAYEVEDPTTESASPYTNPQICDPNGTEEYVDAGVTASTPTRDVAIPVGHETKYQLAASSQVKTAKSIIAPVLTQMKADTALTANDFRIVNNTLYRITTSVSSGATLTPNTNCVATTVAEMLKSLLS